MESYLRRDWESFMATMLMTIALNRHKHTYHRIKHIWGTTFTPLRMKSSLNLKPWHSRSFREIQISENMSTPTIRLSLMPLMKHSTFSVHSTWLMECPTLGHTAKSTSQSSSSMSSTYRSCSRRSNKKCLSMHHHFVVDNIFNFIGLI